MRTTGYVRRVDDLGRIIIPKEIRRNISIREGDPLEIFMAEDGVLFKKYDCTISVKDILSNLGDAVEAGNYTHETVQEIRKCISDLRRLTECISDE